MMDRMMKILDELPDCSLEEFWDKLYADYNEDSVSDEAVQLSDIKRKEAPPLDAYGEDTSDLIGHQDANYLERALRPHLKRPPVSLEQQKNNGQRSQILAPKPLTGQMLQGTAIQNPHNSFVFTTDLLYLAPNISCRSVGNR